MAIPNTTPTPNELFNGEMKNMRDTELRIVLIVTRATLGWEVNKETGRRKEEDWISYYQLKSKTGRGYTALAGAIDNCIKKGWIEARDSKGNLLTKKGDRIGKKIFYRLGRIFLDKIATSSESKEDRTTSSDSVITESVITESEAYKRNTIQKKNYTNSEQGSQINDFIDKFKEINPSYKQLFKNTTQRFALERLLKQHGEEKLGRLLEILPQINQMPYAPTITTPLKLEQKLGDLLAFINKEQTKKDNRIVFIS